MVGGNIIFVSFRRKKFVINAKTISPMASADKRPGIYHRNDCSGVTYARDIVDSEMLSFSKENLVPQQLWDELFESAFKAIEDVSFTDFFDIK